MSNGVGDLDKVKKHIWLYREDNKFLEELIEDQKGVNNFLDAIHYLIKAYKSNSNNDNMQSKLDEIIQRQKSMSLQESTMSEFISDYLYSQQYHDQFVHINHGTDTEAYRNAKKVALSRIKDNQEEHTHRLNQQKAFEKKQERIETSLKNRPLKTSSLDFKSNLH